MEDLTKFIAEQTQYGQLTLDNLLTRRYQRKDVGHSELVLSSEWEQKLIDGFLDVLGGWQKTKAAMRRAIEYRYVRPCGILRRVVAEVNKEGELKFSYCAGQDYTGELQYIRRYLSK